VQSVFSRPPVAILIGVAIGVALNLGFFVLVPWVQPPRGGYMQSIWPVVFSEFFGLITVVGPGFVAGYLIRRLGLAYGAAVGFIASIAFSAINATLGDGPSLLSSSAAGAALGATVIAAIGGGAGQLVAQSRRGETS
jgi:hypothetical protein